MKNKWNKVDNTNEDKIFDQSEENCQKWTDFEMLLQKLIFAIQVLLIFMTHGKSQTNEIFWQRLFSNIVVYSGDFILIKLPISII